MLCIIAFLKIEKLPFKVRGLLITSFLEDEVKINKSYIRKVVKYKS